MIRSVNILTENGSALSFTLVDPEPLQKAIQLQQQCPDPHHAPRILLSAQADNIRFTAE